MPKVVLEQKALEALASETRVGVLKELRDRQKTVTQISRALDVDKGAVFRHLQKLSEGKLVEKDDSHSFTYYRLTWQGRAVVAPQESTRIALAIGSSVASGIGVILALTAYATPRYQPPDPTVPLPAGQILLPPEPMFMAAAIILSVFAAALVMAVARTVWPKRATMTSEDQKVEKTPFFPPPST